MDKETFNRLVEEFKSLNEKVNKLRDFLLNSSEQLDNLNRDMLITQLKVMETYQGILSIRIGLNSVADKSDSEKTETVSE